MQKTFKILLLGEFFHWRQSAIHQLFTIWWEDQPVAADKLKFNEMNNC